MKETTITVRRSDKDRFDEIAENMFEGYDVPNRVILNYLMDGYEEEGEL